MKKILLILLLSLFVTGCSGEDLHYIDPVDTTADGNVADADGAEWIPIPGTVTADGLSGMNTKFIETKNAFVFCDNRSNARTAYISKATGTVSPLCDDPLCSHPDTGVEDMCAVINDVFTSRTLCYSPDSGRLYFARYNDYFLPLTERFYVIYSVDIDNMDLSVREHYRMRSSAVRIESMRYYGGKLYFTYCDMNDNGTEVLMLDTYDTKSGKVENITFFEDVTTYFTVIGDDIYYSDKGFYTLNRYDVTTGNTEEIIGGNDRRTYIIIGNKVYAMGMTAVTMIDLETYGCEELVTYEKNGYGKAAVTADGEVYYILPCLTQTQGFKGGKLYFYGNGESGVYYDFGDDAYIKTVSVYGDNVFAEVEINEKKHFVRLSQSENGVICYYFPEI